MTFGFTGTSRGMTQRQRQTVRYLLEELQVTTLHHGDCVGADSEIHADCLARHINVVIHPPTDDKLRAFCEPLVDHFTNIRSPRPYLARNRDIVAAGIDGLIAAPKDYIPPVSLRGQGTWTTIGYARQAGRYIWIVFPDGTTNHD